MVVVFQQAITKNSIFLDGINIEEEIEVDSKGKELKYPKMWRYAAPSKIDFSSRVTAIHAESFESKLILLVMEEGFKKIGFYEF